MSAGTYNLEIERGETFTSVFTWKDSTNALVNLTGKTARMQIRSTTSSPTVTLDCNSYFTLGGALGTITLEIPATITATLTLGLLRYDLEIVTGANVRKLLKGDVTVFGEVTR